MTHLKGGALALASAISLAGAAHAETQFLAYQGPDAVKQGQGGDMKSVDGVDFSGWTVLRRTASKSWASSKTSVGAQVYMGSSKSRIPSTT